MLKHAFALRGVIQCVCVDVACRNWDFSFCAALAVSAYQVALEPI